MGGNPQPAPGGPPAPETEAEEVLTGPCRLCLCLTLHVTPRLALM